jgi:hypothetical protein
VAENQTWLEGRDLRCVAEGGNTRLEGQEAWLRVEICGWRFK